MVNLHKQRNDLQNKDAHCLFSLLNVCNMNLTNILNTYVNCLFSLFNVCNMNLTNILNTYVNSLINYGSEV